MPLVYKNKYNTQPIALTPVIYRQYSVIMAGLNLHSTGIIYRLKDEGQKTTPIPRLLHLFGYLSILKY
jgi:hypothetical protein